MPKNARHVWTEKQKATILEMKAQGYTNAAIAERFGIYAKSVSTLIERARNEKTTCASAEGSAIQTGLS